ncbi:hypothetical protein DXG01_007499 [Tephrocybe rancida]|nr:hypothetical protein DXG01_007499 [Tephrocybe rancida]
MDDYVTTMKADSPDRAFYRAILSVHQNQFPKAMVQIAKARDLLGPELSSFEHRSTTASSLHSRLNAGHSVYWKTIFAEHDDPTFVFLTLLWCAHYAWDEALEVSHAHICSVESCVIRENDIHLTQELHVIRAHLLHYASLLDDPRTTVGFLDTPYPGLDNPSLYTPEHRDCSKELMKKECNNLLSGIEQLKKRCHMQGKRLKNVMNLGFSTSVIDSSKSTIACIASSPGYPSMSSRAPPLSRDTSVKRISGPALGSKHSTPKSEPSGLLLDRIRAYPQPWVYAHHVVSPMIDLSGDITHEVLVRGAELLKLFLIPGLEGAARVLLGIWDALQQVETNRLARLHLTERSYEFPRQRKRCRIVTIQELERPQRFPVVIE